MTSHTVLKGTIEKKGEIKSNQPSSNLAVRYFLGENIWNLQCRDSPNNREVGEQPWDLAELFFGNEGKRQG